MGMTALIITLISFICCFVVCNALYARICGLRYELRFMRERELDLVRQLSEANNEALCLQESQYATTTNREHTES